MYILIRAQEKKFPARQMCAERQINFFTMDDGAREHVKEKFEAEEEEKNKNPLYMLRLMP
ncbi:MAG: hypothetical protein M0P01_13255 [Treponema sp.]|nr:hypothetical protein [Treponema sp.]